MAKMNFKTEGARARQDSIMVVVRKYKRLTYFRMASLLRLNVRTIQMYVGHMRKTEQLRISGWVRVKGSGEGKRWQPEFGPWVGTRGDEPRPAPMTNAEASQRYREGAASSLKRRKILKKAAENSARRTRELNRMGIAKNAWDPLVRLQIAQGKIDPKPYRRRVTPELVQRMHDLRSEGWTYQKIGLELGVSRDTVSYHYNKEQK